MSLWDEVLKVRENKNISDLRNWHLPNTSTKTNIEGWKEGIRQFSKTNSSIMIEEINKIGTEIFV